MHTVCLLLQTLPFTHEFKSVFSQIKTWFKDLSTSDLVLNGKWKAHADRPVAGLSVGVHRDQCSLCVLAFSSVTRQSEHLHPQLNAFTCVSYAYRY